MAEEDEIDILGDFTLDNLLSKNEIYENTGLASQSSDVLNCDCSSQWLLDQNTSANSTCWYNNGHSDFCTDLGVQEQTDQMVNQISTENSICSESGWTTKEKNLLDRGIEIFGKSNIRLSQFIGSKTSVEVKHYLKHFYNSQNSLTVCESTFFDDNIIEETVVNSDSIEHSSNDIELLEDSEIPASIEEVITVVSTAKPTVQFGSKKSRKNSSSKSNVEPEVNYNDIPSGHSVLKSNVYKHINQIIIDNDDDTSIQRHERSISPHKKRNRKNSSHVKFKFRTRIKVSKEKKLALKRKPVREPDMNQILVPSEPKQFILNINGEEVIKMKKENSEVESESDLEIDVENDEETQETCNSVKKINKSVLLSKQDIISVTNGEDDLLIMNKCLQGKNDETILENTHIGPDRSISEFTEAVSKQLMSMEYPSCELVLTQDEITDLEKCINSEFFEERPTKTPGRYLKIRNHILSTWYAIKPSYVTKTSIRPGLKNCGDVNSIGRIHHFLEQIGAINFGCAQTTYVRPLSDILWANVPTPKERPIKEMIIQRPISLSRPRIKKKFTHDGEGGCTLTHDEKGDVINTTVVNEEPVVRPRLQIKKPGIRLIYCKSFTEEHPQEYSIHLHLSTLLLMDLHAHTSHSEVMGLIGGYWNPSNKTLTISRYVPCRNSAPSATHCEMCPISQASAADTIHGESLNILGWFHSHPTFAPEPSQQDLDTQLSVQQWIGNNKPCIGLILSPFSAHGALIASPYRCLIVDKKRNFEDQYIPYKFKVDLISSNLDVNYMLSQAWRIFTTDCNVSQTDRVNFNKPYFLDNTISYFDKFMSSVRMHLAKCLDINKRMYDGITEGFSSICCNEV